MNTQKWDKIPWFLLEKYILQIQKRIYYAEKKSDNRHVYLLQKRLSESWSFQTKIISESFFFTKNIYEKELLQEFFPFFYNNENIRKKFSNIFSRNKNFFSIDQHKKKQKKSSVKLRKEKSNFLSTKLILNLENFKKQKIITLNKNFFIICILNFFDLFKKQQIVEKFYLNNLERKKNSKEKNLPFFCLDTKNNFFEKQSIKNFLRWFLGKRIFWSKNTLFKYYQVRYLQNSVYYSFLEKKKNNIIINNSFSKNTILVIIENKKKKTNNNKRKEIFFQEKIHFYRKYIPLEKKIKHLLKIFYLTENLSFLNQKETPLKKTKTISSFFPKEKNKIMEIKKIFKLIQIKKQIEPQWKARYEFSTYSLNRGSSAFNKIQAIYKNLRDKPKFVLKIEIKSLAYFFEKRNKINEFENFIYLLKIFFFYGLEKAFFHILKKQSYSNFSYTFSEQILIFDKNQIVILHNTNIFLKKFYQFFIKNLEKKDLDNSVLHLKKNLSFIHAQIVHSFLPYEKNTPGIDFLGFHISQSNKKQYLQKNIDLEYFKKPILNITKLNIQTFITPSLSNIRSHLEQIRTIIKQSKTSTQEVLINRLSPKIRGWSKFYSQLFFILGKPTGYQKVASYCDYLTVKMLWRWAYRRHPKKNRKWIKLKYFKTLHGKNWIFCVAKKQELLIKNFSNNENSHLYPKFSYLCLPLHREIEYY